MKQGLPDAAITALHADHEGALWIVAGSILSRYQDGQFTNFKPDTDIPVTFDAGRSAEDAHHDLWVAGFSRVVRRTGGKFVTVMQAEVPGRNGGAQHDGRSRRQHLDRRQARASSAGPRAARFRSTACARACPDSVVRALWADRDGNIWAGTNYGMARLQGNRFVRHRARTIREDGDVVRCLFEDREGDLWIGPNGGLSRWRNDIFMVYGKPEGLPSDAPNTVFQDRDGRVWVGFNDLGMMLFSGSESRQYHHSRRAARQRGLSDSGGFEGRSADCHACPVWRAWRTARFRTYRPPDPLARQAVFDALEDAQGALWLATPAG